jgi:protein gp37
MRIKTLNDVESFSKNQLIENVNLSAYLHDIELVVVGGESDNTHFIKDDKLYTLKVRDLCNQAKKANINF